MADERPSGRGPTGSTGTEERGVAAGQTQTTGPKE